MKKNIALMLMLVCLSVANPAVPSQEYEANEQTYLLMHFNGDLTICGQNQKASARLFGDAKLVDNGWCGGALDPGKNGGCLIQTDTLFNPPYEHVTVEARIFLRNYPGDKGFILEKVFECRNPVVHNTRPEEAAIGFSVFVDNQGRLGNELTSIYYGPKHKAVFYTPDNYRLPLGRWVHIAVVNAGWPVGKYTIYVDRVPVLSTPHEYTHRVFYGIPENKPGQIVIGNNASGKAPFDGLIDEVRILGANLELTLPADLSWTDPQSRRPLKEGPPFFLPETIPSIYLSCDGTEEARTKDNQPLTVKFTGGKFVPGVRGQAYSGGNIELRQKKIIIGSQGTVTFWMMPENWNNRTVQNHGFFSGGPYPFFNFYVFNSPGDLRPLSLYFPNDEKQNTFVSVDRFIDEANWHHFVLTWENNTYRIYLDGILGVERELRNIEEMIKAEREYLTFTGRRGDKTAAFDEIFIYPRALTPDEAWNAFARYRYPEKVRTATPYAIRWKQYPSREMLRVEIKFLQGQVPGKMRLDIAQGNNNYQGKMEPVPTGSKEFSVQTSTASLSPKNFTARLLFFDTEGKNFFTTHTDLMKKGYPWLGNRLGIPEKVPEPWVPLTLNNQRVRCLLTEYDFSRGFLNQVTTNGDSLLQSPILLSGLDSSNQPLLLRQGPIQVKLGTNGLYATATTEWTGSGMKARCTGKIDFDGFIKYYLTLTSEKDSAVINHLSLQVPFRQEQALDYYLLGEHMDHVAQEVPKEDGCFWNSLTGKMFKRHELPEYGAMDRPRRGLVYGNFIPFVWLGNHHRGLCFMADNDKGWVQSNEKPAVELVRKNQTVYLVLNLVAEPVTLKEGQPREIIFSLMATPSKKPASGWRHWKTSSFFVISAAGRVMGNDIFYAPYPVDYQKSAAYMENLWKNGIVPLPYMDFYGSDGRMEPAEDFRWEWWPEITAEEFPARSQIYKANYCSGSLIDWYIYNFNRWVDECGVNGLYIDNSYPSPIFDAVNGPGYIHEKGEVQPGYQLFAMREFYKRVYCLLAGKGKPHPYTMIHMTHCMIAPAMSFADIAYEGEDHYINGENEKGNEQPGADHITYWPNHIVRIIDFPHAWGVGTHWLTAVRGKPELWKLPPSRDYYIRAWYTQLLLHDMRGSVDRDGGAMAVFEKFLNQDPEVEFVLYRDNQLFLPDTKKDIYISYYQRKKEFLVVIGNHNKEQQNISVSVQLPGEFTVTDAETNEAVGVSGKSFAVTVAGRNYRLLIVK